MGEPQDADDHAKKMKKEKKNEKKNDKKSKKERKEVLASIHTEEEEEMELPVEPFQEEAETHSGRQKKKSKKDKEKKKKEKKEDPTKDEKTSDIDVEHADENQMKTDTDHNSTKKKSRKHDKKDNDDKDDKELDNKQDRKRKREEKRQRKKALLEQVPKQDKDGISYTKQQIRRMLRRVEKGLPPVPTPQEEAELKRQATLLRAEDEAELAGMLDDENEDNNKEDDEDDDAPEEDEDSITHNEHDRKQNAKVDENQHANVTRDDRAAPPSKKRKISKKPVPPDYVCQACKNKHEYPHWIYDCPDKVSVPGTNHVSAGKRPNGINNDNLPSAKKVFVSGLFFDMKPNQVKSMFQACGKVKSCKLLTFPDTGRCKGQAFVVFETEESAKKALQLSGTKISTKDYITKDKKKKKNGSSNKETETERELELKVHKVLSRALTKNKS